MKAARTEDSGTSRRAADVPLAPEAPPQPRLLAAVASEPALGIPEHEFTPRVRTAILGLLNEIRRLKKEAAGMRVRLEEAARAADLDTLVPLFNRRAFVREVSRFISLAGRYGTASSVIYIDLDDFKGINDAYGHAAGDAMLRHIADILTRQVRDTDVVARIGGDEFGIVLAHVNLAQAVKKAVALDRALRERPLIYNGHTLALGFSFGSYELKAGESADSAIAQADAAMYAQKRGRDA
jgi:diguanylate cyclase (GGDEF)-like protein